MVSKNYQLSIINYQLTLLFIPTIGEVERGVAAGDFNLTAVGGGGRSTARGL